jgi:hypothetical protein
MKLTKDFDLALNTAIPLLAGATLYYFKDFIHPVAWVNNHLADFLWAYAFISSVFIIWDREPGYMWIFIPFAVAAVFEVLQYFHLIAGSGDFLDIITYYFSFMIAIAVNKIFTTKTKFQLHEPETPA